MDRKFFKTTITITVLSEDEPISPDSSLDDVIYEITEGNCSGDYEVSDVQELSPEETAKALIEQGSDPSFFELNMKEAV